MAITPNNYSFSGGAFMGGSDSPVTPEDIHTLNLSKNGESIGNYNPLVGDAIIDIPSDAFVCYYDSTTAAQIHDARRSGKAPYLYKDGIIVPLWKTETGKFTFRTTSTREVDGGTYLDIVDYVVEGLAWSTETHTVSGSGGTQQAYIKKVSSLAVFDTTGHSGMETVAYVNDVPVDGIYQVSVMLSVTPKAANPTKSDLVFGFYGSAGVGLPDHTFHAVVDDSQTFAQQLSFSTTLNLKAGTSSLKMQCGGLNTEYLVFVDDLTVAGLVVGSPEPTPVVTSGANIYLTLQDAITDATNLSVGDIFETNGFHTSGDGGAARYAVSSTGTGNGMDIIQLAAGKLAVLQAGDWIVPEQLGYAQSYSRDDVVPYIQRAIAIGCQHIHLRSSGNGAGYTWKSKLTINSRGFKITGEGDWGYPNKFTYIVFRPTDVTVDAMIDMKARDVVLKDLDIEVTGDYVKAVDGVTNTGYDSDENRFWEIDNVRFNSFNNCIKFSGGIKWQNSIKNCLFNSCNIGLQIYESSTFELIMENCLFTNCEQYDVLVNGNLFAALFNSCGFGSQGKAIGLTTNSDDYLYQNIKFEGCNFELDNLAIQNAPALFIDCFPDPSHPYIRQNVTLSNCHLTVCKVDYTVQDTTNRFFRLAPKTNLLLIANQILGKDEPQHLDWVVYPKLLWNENYLPILGFGGIIECGNNLCGNGNFEYPDQLLPFVTRDTQARSVLSIGAQSGTESAIADCNAFIPAHCGELIIGRGSTFESTANMPTTSIFGFLYSVGVTEGPNKRVIQMMMASNSNIYTRVGRDTGGGWLFDPWKTITAT